MRGLFRTVLSVLVVMAIPSAALAAQWARTYGPESHIARSVQPTTDGGYVLAGGASRDAWVMKLDGNGNVTWQKTFDSGGLDDFNAVHPTPDGGYVVAGVLPSPTVGWLDAWFVKLDAFGNVQWQKGYGGERGGVPNDIRPTLDGGFVVAGTTSYFQGGWFTHGWVLRLDAAGELIWQKIYGPTTPEPADWYLNVIQTKAGGGYIAAGARFARHLLIVELDDAGNIVWQKTYRAPGDEVTLNDLCVTADGGFIAVGTNFPGGLDFLEGWIVKFDANGNIAWQKTVGRRFADDNDGLASVQPTVDGGYLVVGGPNAYLRSEGNAAIWKFDANGTALWKKTYGGSLHDDFSSIQATDDGGFVILGWTESFGPSSRNTWVLKLDGEEAELGCLNEATAAPLTLARDAIASSGTGTVGTVHVMQRQPVVATSSTVSDTWQQCPVMVPSSQLTAIEYYHPNFDHYFITTLKDEIDALDGGTIPGWWRSSLWFRVLGLDVGEPRVCRFWSGQTFAPKSSHFYTPLDWECETVQSNSDWQFEGEVFAMKLPDVLGNCAGGTGPLYRLYNDGRGGAPNHRYTTSPFIQQAMLAKGWKPEGVGVGVIGCVSAP